jgi:hypothetical protein
VESERSARRNMRYPVVAQVFFRWKDAEGDEHRGKGTSRDISETGAFVVTRVPPLQGVNVELRVFFPALPNAATAVCVKLGGRVLRVEDAAQVGGIGGFAVLTTAVIFRENRWTASRNLGADDATG